MSDLSAVAGIVGSNGDFRVVVTQRWRMKYHVKKGERLFVLPDCKVQEPVSVEDAWPLINRVQEHIRKWAWQRNEPLPSAISEWLRRQSDGQ